MADTLSQASCSQIFQGLKDELLSNGMMAAIDLAIERCDGDAQRALQSFYDQLLSGASFQIAVNQTNPQWPSSIQTLLIRGVELGMLDMVLEAVEKAYERFEDPSDFLDAYTNKLKATDGDGTICVGCLEHELEKIMNRAQVEGASKVYLSQQGKEFFTQKYVADKVVQVTEFNHSMTIHTIAQELSNCVSKKQGVTIGEETFQVEVPRDGHFQLKSPTRSMTLAIS